MKYRVQTYQGLKGMAARRRWRVGLIIGDGQTIWGDWVSSGYTQSENAEMLELDRVRNLAEQLEVEIEYEMPMRED